MSNQSREVQERRDTALAYAVESTKGADPDRILESARKFFVFLSNSVTEDAVTKDSVTKKLSTQHQDGEVDATETREIGT